MADIIVQDRRFLIVKDLGCQVAVHNSILALIIVWLPPLCISTVAIFYCRELNYLVRQLSFLTTNLTVSAAINIGKHRYNSRPCFPSSPEMTFSLFVPRIFFTASGMLYVACVYVYVVSSVTSPGLKRWTSISQIRSQVGRIEIVSSSSQISIQSELIWWFIPVLSLLFCLLSAVGEETRRGYRSVLIWLSQPFKRNDLPTQYVPQDPDEFTRSRLSQYEVICKDADYPGSYAKIWLGPRPRSRFPRWLVSLYQLIPFQEHWLHTLHSQPSSTGGRGRVHSTDTSLRALWYRSTTLSFTGFQIPELYAGRISSHE